MRVLLKLILWLLFLSPFAIAALFWLLLSDTPLIAEQPPLSQADVLRAKAIIEQHRRQQNSDQPLRLVLSERDLELAGTYLLRHLTESSLRIRIQDHRLQASATLRVPGFPTRPYLNLQLRLQDQQGSPNLVQLRIDRFIVPRVIAKPLLAELLIRMYASDEYRLARNIVDELRLQDKQLQLRYYWTPELARQARATFLRETQPARRVYRTELQRLVQAQPSHHFSLAAILPPLFQLALKRSQQGDPVEENRALLSVLGYWASGRPSLATELLGRDAGPALPFRARLNRRRDQARHFLISAAIAARIDGGAASLAGTLKEIADADKGSGFSFIDLAADRAGTRFGEQAVASAPLARRLQQLISSGIGESDIVPPVDQLSEGLDSAQFTHRYGTLDSPAYREMLEQIDTLIGRCRLYRELDAPRT